MSDYSVDIIRAIYNDNTGECIEVRPDRDGLGLVEVYGTISRHKN